MTCKSLKYLLFYVTAVPVGNEFLDFQLLAGESVLWGHVAGFGETSADDLFQSINQRFCELTLLSILGTSGFMSSVLQCPSLTLKSLSDSTLL